MKEKWHTGAFCDPHMQVNTSYTIRSLQKNGRSHHRNDHHYCAHDEPVSPDSPCPRRLIFLLLPIVCGSLCCPPEFFSLLGFIMSAMVFPYAMRAVVVCGLIQSESKRSRGKLIKNQ
jgi:hypothetical protein